MTISTDQLLARIARVSTAVGLDATDTQLVHHYGSSVAVLPHAHAVVRVTTGTPRTLQQVARSQDICRDINTTSTPIATQPLDINPIALDDSGGADALATFWTYYPQPKGQTTPPTFAELGTVLKQLHSTTPEPAHLRDWIPLAGLESAVVDANGALTASQRSWLLDAIDRTRQDMAKLDSPLGQGMIHGDTWRGNLLRRTDGELILCDWDDVGRGPREIDVIPVWHTVRRYRTSPQAIKDFKRVYGADLTNWPGLEPTLRMRDLMQLTGPLRHATTSPRRKTLFEQRIHDMINNRTHRTWDIT